MSSPVRIRGGRGLGDALYVRPIVEQLVREGRAVTVLTDYPDVYLGSGARTEPFQRIRAEIVAHYVGRKDKPGTTQWEDVCLAAGVSVPLAIHWKQRNSELLHRLRARAGDRRLVLVHGGRAPMQRQDGFGMELLPTARAFEVALGVLRADCYLVQIGKARQLYAIRADENLNGSTSVADLLDIAQGCDAVVAQCSFAIPLAEAFGKPLLAIWGERTFSSPKAFIRLTTPEKVLSAPGRDVFVVDDWPEERIREVASAFRRLF